jgi:DNA-binding MarR family transcriptional regulator
MSRRDRLETALTESLKQLGELSRSFEESRARRLGVNGTDLRCLRLLQGEGVTTAGDVAREMGLTTGATTAVLDRLERRGFVRRTRDRRDRRRVTIGLTPAAQRHLQAVDDACHSKIKDIGTRLNDQELAALIEHLTRVVEIGDEHAASLQKKPAAESTRRGPVRRRVSSSGSRAPS